MSVETFQTFHGVSATHISAEILTKQTALLPLRRDSKWGTCYREDFVHNS